MFGFIGDLVEVATAPIRIVDSLAREVTKPLAEAAKDVAEQFKDSDQGK